MSEKQLKRDNWTNEEVVALILGRKLEDGGHSEAHSAFVEAHNYSVEDVAAVFEEFMQPLSEWGAMAYNPETGCTEHVGGQPEHSGNYEGPHYAPSPEIKGN